MGPMNFTTPGPHWEARCQRHQGEGKREGVSVPSQLRDWVSVLVVSRARLAKNGFWRNLSSKNAFADFCNF